MKIAIVEDHALIRDLLRVACERELGAAATVAATGSEGVSLVCQSKPDIVLLDVCLPDMDGFEVVSRVRKHGASPRFIVVSARCDPRTVHRAKEMQLSGFIDKRSTAPDEFKAAVRAVERGSTYFCPAASEVQRKARKDPKAFFKLLTRRQQEILSLLGGLFTDDEIAGTLNLSTDTAEKHRFRIMRRLGLGSRSDLIRYARRTGFRPLDSENE